MKRIRHIALPNAVPENEPAREAVREFAQRNGLTLDNTLYYHFEEADPRLPELCALLSTFGMELLPKGEHGPYAEDTFLKFVRNHQTIEFERQDWEAAEYLKPEPVVRFDGVDDFTYGEGRAVEFSFRGRVPKSWSKVDISFNDSTWDRYIVSDRARRAIETAELRHAVFRPLICGEYYRKHGAPVLWELASDLLLPPMSRSIVYRDNRWHECSPDDPRPVTRDPRPEDGMWAYERSAIESVGPFDVARTAEPNRGPTMPLEPETNLIVSKKFYELFRDHKFKCSWIPVRIIEDK